MKKSLLLTLALLTFGANAQQKLIGKNTTQFDETGAIVLIDSSEFIYNTWDGSLFSNEPQFTFDGAVFDWYYEEPAIKWDTENRFTGTSLPLPLYLTFNNTIVGGNATVSESVYDKTEFTYDAAGNTTVIVGYYWDGTSFVLNDERNLEYNTNNDLTRQTYTYYGGGSAQLQTIDSFFYDPSFLMTRAITYDWDGNQLMPSSESLITYTGSEVANIKLYQGSPLEWAFDIDYVFTSGKPTNIIAHQVTGGIPDPTPLIEINYTYGSNGKINMYEGMLGGDLFNMTEYAYDAQGFVTDLIMSDLDFNTSTIYVSEEQTFYYQSTAELSDVVAAEAIVFPNPSSDIVTISTDAQIESVAVFASNGAIMLSQTNGTIDISNLPVGVYIAKVKTLTGVAQARFVKQ